MVVRKEKVNNCIRPDTFRYSGFEQDFTTLWGNLEDEYGESRKFGSIDLYEINTNQFLLRGSFTQATITMIRKQKCSPNDVLGFENRIDYVDGQNIQLKIDAKMKIIEASGISPDVVDPASKPPLKELNKILPIPTDFMRWFLSKSKEPLKEIWKGNKEGEKFSVLAMPLGDVTVLSLISQEQTLSNTEATKQKAFYWKNLIDNFSQGILIFDLDGLIIECTTNLAGLMNLTNNHGVLFNREGLLDRNIDVFLESELLERVNDYVKKVPHNTILPFRHELRTKKKVLETVLYPNTDEDRVVSISMLVFDITQRVRTEEQLKERDKERFHQGRLASIGELAAGVGHEINNPLTIANGNVDRIESELKKDAPSMEVIQTSLKKYRDATTRIANIVLGLRTFARNDTDHFASMDINEIVDQTVSLVREIYCKDGIELDLQLPSETVTIEGNIGRIQQALMNLVSNAKDAVLEVPMGRIEVKLELTNEIAHIAVKDNGTGIPKHLQEKIFDNFFTTKATGKGTGMGLTLTHTIVREHRGELKLESEPGKGTTFTMSIPASLKKTTKQQTENQLSETQVQDNLKVLVVDDEEDIREILRDILEGLGCIVEEAPNGQEALELIKNKAFDKVFMDMQMPVMNGPTLLKEIHNLKLDSKPKLFVITGGVTTDFSKEGREELTSLIDGYLLKPFDQQKLIKLLSSQKVAA